MRTASCWRGRASPARKRPARARQPGEEQGEGARIAGRRSSKRWRADHGRPHRRRRSEAKRGLLAKSHSAADRRSVSMARSASSSHRISGSQTTRTTSREAGMADKLLVRAYNVEVGDCIYCRIPKAQKGRQSGRRLPHPDRLRHGRQRRATWRPRSQTSRRAAGRWRRQEAPRSAGGHPRAQGPHRGLRPELFKNIKIENIWMNAAMDPEHPQADSTLQLHSLATTAMRNSRSLNLVAEPGARRTSSRSTASTTTTRWRRCARRCRRQNGIEPKYVHAGMTPARAGARRCTARRSRVLGPEQDIDHFYLGEEVDETLQGLVATGRPFQRRRR